MEVAPYHVPVLLREVLDFLDPARGGLYFDGTVGGGGHGEAILEAAGTRLLGVDRDPEALDAAARRLARFEERVDLVQGNFADVAERGVEPLAGALLDLGLSSRHLDVPERGFSFRPGTPLDMRMAGRAEESTTTAADLLNHLPQEELANLFFRYGEERRSRRLAAEVVRRRRERPFAVSDDLLAVLARVFGPRVAVKTRARLFQALRIAVNDELGALERVLPVLRQRLEPAGTLVVISYHSLEDRPVKESFREWSRGCICPPELPICQCRGVPLGQTLTRKPVFPAPEEVERNPRARSARLRAWRKAA
ncbi:MAG: 16S rRNA (cytosine(1402)-N(4))-methyltransferase RsmH [Gemmatimonadetes bacterium]|nr:16S rRNA (cytosine(1402)-N(4))-methyltransferase RsmH [Gemmatimonadota bacterium]